MTRKKVLIAPLDWGLGHASRCILVINELIKEGAQIYIASDGEISQFLKKEFPEARYIHLKGYHIKYSAFFPMWLMILIQVPKIVFRIFHEHQWLKKIIHKENIDAVISDNRFGLWNRKIKSVYITHQVMIKCPDGLKFLEPLLYRMHRFFISKYDACWVPDYPGEKNLSSDLSHLYRQQVNVKFIGPLSRFKNHKTDNYEYEIAAIISGTEPHRSILEKKILKALEDLSVKSIVISGKPSENKDEMRGSVRYVSHLPSLELEKIIGSSKLVICRAGYSSIMDLVRMKKNAVLIPTPGQTEQEYLAATLMNKEIFYSVAQDKFNLQEAIAQSKNYSVEKFSEENYTEDLLKKELELL